MPNGIILKVDAVPFPDLCNRSSNHMLSALEVYGMMHQGSI
jgi:hypothetical protein